MCNLWCQGTHHRGPLLLRKDVVGPDHRTIVLGTPSGQSLRLLQQTRKREGEKKQQVSLTYLGLISRYAYIYIRISVWVCLCVRACLRSYPILLQHIIVLHSPQPIIFSPNLHPWPPASDTKGPRASAVGGYLLVGTFSATSQGVKLLNQLSFFFL